MKSKLKVLMLEDNAADAELVAAQLDACGLPFQVEPIRSEADLRKQMETQTPDLILSDHGFPSFSGFKALAIVRATHPDLPFIFVSGSNDQGMVARMFEQGATDYVYKRDLGDLKSAVLRVLEMKNEAAFATSSEPAVAEPELNLSSHPAPPTPEKVVSGLSGGNLFFCPQCRRFRDEAGANVDVVSQCDNQARVVVQWQLCPDCVRPQRPG